MRLTATMATLFALVLAAAPARAGDDLHALVREGQRHFEAGDFAKAQESFASAELLAPEDAHIAYNRARAYQAEGDLEKAKDYYQRAALAVDVDLAPRIAFNRGAMSVAAARALLGENPVAVTGETRDEVLELFKTAVRHYRGVSEWGVDDSDARYNIELVRIFVKDLRDRWRQADRKKARDETDLLKYLEYLMSQQKNLEHVTEAIDGGRTDGRQAVRLEEIRILQGELADEMPHLRVKVKDWVAKAGEQTAAPGGAHPGAAHPGGATPPPDPQRAEMLEKAEKQLLELVDRAESGMEAAVRELAAVNLAAARVAEGEAHARLLDMWKGLADFQALLKRAISRQDGLVERAGPPADDANELEAEAAADLGKRLVRDQSEVRDLIPLLEGRARALQQQLASASQGGPGQGPAGAAPGASPGGGPDPAKMKASVDKALELLPKADEAMDRAAAGFEKRAWTDGLGQAEEAAKILHEIAKLFQDEDQQKKDQKKQDKKDQDPQNQDPKKQDEQKKDQQREQDPDQKKKMSREEAERQLRKMRENRNKREKRRREAVGARRIRVEKDW